MNVKVLKAALAGLVLSVSGFANAGLIQSDYLNSGDNLSVLDTASNIEWLDLSVSTSWSFSNWNSLVQQGNGWRLATNSEVVNLFNTAFPTYAAIYGGTGYVDTNDVNLIQNFIDFQTLFGTTIWNANNVDSYGLFKNENGISEMMGVSRWSDTYRIFSTNFNSSVPEINNGIYIVRDATSVPEPSTLAIFALGVMGLASRRFKKQ